MIAYAEMGSTIYKRPGVLGGEVHEEPSPVCITSRLMRDFLVYEKGYCLIHDPAGTGYIVTYKKPFTKKQREFLYDYFIAAGDKTRAREYLEH